MLHRLTGVASKSSPRVFLVNPEAMKIAGQAVELDTAGRWEEAVPLYEQSATMILGGNPTKQEKYGFRRSWQLKMLVPNEHLDFGFCNFALVKPGLALFL